MTRPKPRDSLWLGKNGKEALPHHSHWMKNQGLPSDLFGGRPVIGGCNAECFDDDVLRHFGNPMHARGVAVLRNFLRRRSGALVPRDSH